MHRKRRAVGFTLVEIMIVLAILVLLLAMVGPRLLKTQEKADLKIAITQIKNIQEALDFYKVDNRSYPTTEEGLQVLLEKPADEARAANWDGPYLNEDKLPVDPWGNAYAYEYPPTKGKNRDTPNVWSFGPDSQDNTEDDLVNWTKAEGDDTGGDRQPEQTAARNP
jgi:general secretion pathway protein G